MSWFNPMSSSAGFVGSAAGYIPFAAADLTMTDAVGLAFIGGALRLDEQAAQPTSPAATFGYLWVKSTTPNTLIFTDDAGTDFDLSAGSVDNTLDQAYDQGGAGVGRTITVDSGPVQLNASALDALGIALATDTNISGLVITEDSGVIRTAPMIESLRQAASTGSVLHIGTGDASFISPTAAIAIAHASADDAVYVALATSALNQALVIVDQDNVARTAPAIEITRQALAIGQGIKFAHGGVGADLALTCRTADPTTLVDGDLWYNTTADFLRFHDGVAVRNVSFLNKAQLWTAGQHDTPLVMDLTGATTTIDVNARNQFYGVLSITTTALQIPTNIAAGQWFSIDIQQAAAGGKALTFVASYDFGDAGAPDFTTLAANDYATITCHVLPDGAIIESACSLNSSLIGAGTDNHIPRYNGTAKLQNSGWVIADTTYAMYNDGAESILAPTTGYGVSIQQAVGAGVTPAEALTITGGAHTTVTTTAEAVDVLFGLARTVQWATGAIASQRAVFIEAPTYGFVGASTITNAATVYIDGAPVAGTNATLTSTAALWIALANSATILANNGLVFTDALNAARTGNFIKATACALATGAMIDLTPGAATLAAMRVRGGKVDFSVAGDNHESIQATDVNGGTLWFYANGTLRLLIDNDYGTTVYGASTHRDDAPAQFGNAYDACLKYATAQTPDSLVLGLSAESNNLIVCRKADVAYDFARPIRTNPTICLESAARSATAWTELSHGLIETGAGDLTIAPASGYGVTILQAVGAGVTPAEALTITGGAHTTITAHAEIVDVLFDIGRSVEWATGPNATAQRFVWFEQPTMTVASLPGDVPCVDAATVYIAGAPVAGANCAITHPWALWIDAGATRLDGSVFMLEAAAAAADYAAFGQFWVKDDAPNIAKFTNDAGTDFSLQLYTRMAHKLVGPAPSSAVAASIMSMTGATNEPSASLSMIHCTAAGSVIGLAATLSAARDANVTVTVEISTDDGDSFAAMGTPCAITVATAARGNEATFVKGTHTFAAGDVLHIIATYTGSSTAAVMSANIDVEYAS